MSPVSQPFRFVDAHVHFWDHSVDGLVWRYLEAGFDHPRLRGMHRLDAPAFTDVELLAQAGAQRPHRVVHVQSCEEAEPGLESAWIQTLADRRGLVGAMVARARVAEENLQQVLEANATHPCYRGVRDMASAQTIGTVEFTAGFERIADHGSSLEVLVPYGKYREVCELADRRPDARIIVGHAGLAEHRDRDYFRSWSRHLSSFSTRPNVFVKISALASGADPDWTATSIRPWIVECIETFGPTRVMFASNWPIDRLYGGYERLIDAYLSATEDYGEADRDALFAGTATRVYDLSPD
jgi:predicted TIM-barrel fold metal-dependent hydrolase